MRLDERGKQCPLPVIDTKKALERCSAGEIVEVTVDNEIAVQNLRKMADHKGLKSSFEKTGDREFQVRITAGNAEPGRSVGGQAAEGGQAGVGGQVAEDGQAAEGGQAGVGGMAAGNVLAAEGNEAAGAAQDAACQPDCRRKGMVVVLSSNRMGQGDEILGKLLMKGFVYALTEQDSLPETILLYNSGAYLSCEGSDNVEDLRNLEAQGVEILTCGTCLNHYGLGDKLKVGSVTNMYEIAERMTGARLLVRP
ncbi:sulfurtransferase-like selenium metabolism protein YedF [Enterocloster aldenensis]|uniref:sulfurtransferase-like selenium metabolism protein YedF n=1 Tax=Enterocloster aldenensis TaxID=358742 RepID=UPI000E4FFEA9|nr:sulfurtransferase-like selenium metabolism protein YedF [Enterocloster aldenensis]